MSRSILIQKLAVGALASVPLSTASGAIVVFDMQNTVLSPEPSGTYIGFGNITLSGGVVAGSFTQPFIYVYAGSNNNSFVIAGRPINVTAAGASDLIFLNPGDAVSAASLFEDDSYAPLSSISLGVHYVGLQWNSGEQDYYGWLQFTRTSESEFQFNQFAFNTVAGESIFAGQTTAVPEASTLGLVGGLFGLVAAAHVRRRKARQAAASEKFLALAAGEKLN
jgi:hypothetical protein